MVRESEYLNAENLYMPLADQDGIPSYGMGYCRYTPRFAVNDIDMEAELENEIASIPGESSYKALLRLFATPRSEFGTPISAIWKRQF